MNKKLTCSLLALTLAFNTAPMLSNTAPIVHAQENEEVSSIASTTYNITGVGVKAPTQEQIAGFYNAREISTAMGYQSTYSTSPVTDATSAAAYTTPGALDSTTENHALNTLNYVRYIAGLGYNVSIDSSTAYSTAAQNASYLNNYNGYMSHYPQYTESYAGNGTQTGDASEANTDLNGKSYYTTGVDGAAASNLGWASGSIIHSSPQSNPTYPSTQTLSGFIVEGWMEDGDSSNIKTVGHRRWCLDPNLNETGFGQVTITEDSEKDSKYYYTTTTHSAMYVKDAQEPSTLQGVIWPAQNTPIDVFTASTSSSGTRGDSYPWSYTYGKKFTGTVTVTVTNLDTNTTYNFDSSASGGYTSGSYISLQNEDSYAGQQGCVIFDPEILDYAHGDTFWVEIKDGSSTIASYPVEFFDRTKVTATTSITAPSETGTTFTYGGSGDNGGSSTPDTTTHTVTNTLKNLTSNGATTATDNVNYTATLTAGLGYILPDSITVTMDGTPLASGTGYTYSSTTGEITIKNASGAIVITAEASKNPLSVNPVTHTTTVGAAGLQLVPTYDEGDIADIEYSSSSTTVATVDATGFVTPVGVGTSTITLTVPGTNYKATVTITVLEPQTYTVTTTGVENLTFSGSNTATGGSTSYTASLTAKSGYYLPSTITVKMGSTTLTADTDYTYNSSTGEIAITKAITGNIVITAVGQSLPSVPTPTITGDAEVGYELSVTVTDGTELELTGYTIQWYADGLAISGANATTFTPAHAQLGAKITVGVKAPANSEIYNSNESISSATTEVQAFYTITFKNGDDTTTTPAVTTKGDATIATIPPLADIKENDKVTSAFAGWYTDAGVKVTTDTVFTGDTTVTARFIEVVKVTVEAPAQGETSVEVEVEITNNGTAVDLSALSALDGLDDVTKVVINVDVSSKVENFIITEFPSIDVAVEVNLQAANSSQELIWTIPADTTLAAGVNLAVTVNGDGEAVADDYGSITFSHSGSLGDKGLTLQFPTAKSVGSNDTIKMYKIVDGNKETPVNASYVGSKTIKATFTTCSTWAIDVTPYTSAPVVAPSTSTGSSSGSSSGSTYSASNSYTSGTISSISSIGYIAEFRNVLLGELINLDKIDVNGMEIIGWYYDPEFTQQVTNTSTFVVTQDIFDNGIYPKFATTVSDTLIDGSTNAGYVDTTTGSTNNNIVHTAVPSTFAKLLAKLF